MRKRCAGRHRRAAVGGLADTVEHAAKQSGPEREMQRLAQETHAHVAQAKADGGFQHLDHHGVLIERGDAAELGSCIGAQYLHRFVEADLDIAPQEQERAIDGGRGAMHEEVRAHESPPFPGPRWPFPAPR